MKRYFYFVCLLAFFTASCSDDFTEYESHQPLNEKTVSEIAQTLEMSFASKVTRSYVEEMNYPDYYGGVFLNEDGELVVLTKGDCELYRQELTTRAASDNFILKPCDYSLNELQEVADELKLYKNNNPSVCEELQFYGFGIKTDLNRVMVFLGDCSQASIGRFKATVLNDSRIIFQQDGMMTADVGPGGVLGSGTNLFSMGYRAKSGNTEVLVTSGHPISNGETLKINGSEAGTCILSMTSQSIDASFCQVNVPLSNVTTYGFVTLLPMTMIPIANMPVMMEGSATQLNDGGIIFATGMTRDIIVIKDGETHIYTLNDLCLATYPSQSGDSGGIVYDKNESFSAAVYGIHVAHSSDFSVFCLASNINLLLGLEMY